MVNISIEIITKGENTLLEVIKSIENQNYKDYEIICVNSSDKSEISNFLHEHNVLEVKVANTTPHLKARYIANTHAQGKYRLILDSTRPLVENALTILTTKYNNYSAVCLKEGSIGTGFWVNQSNKLKLLSENLFSETVAKKVAYLLPRYFKGEVLDNSFTYLKENIDPSIFDTISYGEHHLIYEAANLTENQITITTETLLNHYEDKTAIDIIKKYKWYGKSQKVLKKINNNSHASKLTSHIRPLKFKNIPLEIETLPIKIVRIISFVYGYVL